MLHIYSLNHYLRKALNILEIDYYLRSTKEEDAYCTSSEHTIKNHKHKLMYMWTTPHKEKSKEVRTKINIIGNILGARK